MTSSVWDWSTTAGSNGTVAGINIAEGCDPGNVNNAIRAVMAAAKGAMWGGTTGGTANAQTVTLTPAPAALVASMTALMIAGSTNTASMTLNANSLGAKNVFYRDEAIPANLWASGTLLGVVYDGTQWQILSGAAVPTLGASAAASGTSIDFTGIPAWVKRVTIGFQGVSTNGTALPSIQIGDSGGIETSGYLGSKSAVVGSASVSTFSVTELFIINSQNAAAELYGSVVLTLASSSDNRWMCSGILGRGDTTAMAVTAGSKDLSGTLDRIRITTSNGTDAYDGGSISILYE